MQLPISIHVDYYNTINHLKRQLYMYAVER